MTPNGDTTVAETVLRNGVRVLTEEIPGVRSVASGVWVRQGSAHEAPDVLGASHLLEHLAFKGTPRRTAAELAAALEGLGGSLDAYTSREHTSFQARVLDEHLPDALDVLADLVLSPLLREEDLQVERQVVLEEISAVEDTPDDLVFELHHAHLWNGHPYGRSILGTRESVSNLTSQRLQELHEERYVGAALVVAAAGSVTHDDVVEQAAELFGSAPAGESADPVAVPEPLKAAHFKEVRTSAQTHVVIGSATVSQRDPRRYALLLLSTALGGGMSSRLFQTVREELGLAYAVYSFQSFHSVAGMAGAYVGTRPEWVERVVDAVNREYGRVSEEGLPAEEMERAKQQMKGRITLSLESTVSRLYRLVGAALNDEPYLRLDELLARISAVSAEEVADVAQAFFRPDHQVVMELGPGSDRG